MSLAKLKRDVEILKHALDVTEDDPPEIDFRLLPKEKRDVLVESARIYIKHQNRIHRESGDLTQRGVCSNDRESVNVPYSCFSEAEKKVMLASEEIWAEYGEPRSVIKARERRNYRSIH